MGFRIDTFELWCWRRLLRVPWTARRLNRSILKENSPDYSLEALMLKLKLQSFGHLMQRDHSLEKALMLGKIEGKRRKGATKDEMVEWHPWLNGHEFEHTLGDKPGKLQAMGSQKDWYDLATELQQTVPQYLVYLYCCRTITTTHIQNSLHFVKLKLW